MSGSRPRLGSITIERFDRLEFVLLVRWLLWGLFSSWSSSILVKLGDNWLNLALKILLLLLKFFSGCISVGSEPRDGLIDGFLNGLLVILIKLSSEFFLVSDLVLEGIGVGFKLVTGLGLLLDQFVILSELLGVIDHALNVFGAESVLVVGDGDLVLVSGSLILGGNVEDSVDVDFKGDFDLWNSTWCWWESDESLVTHLDGDGWLVVSGGREDLGLLGWDDSVTADKLGHDSSDGLNTHGKWVDIKKNNLSGVFLSRDNSSLDGGSVGNGLIRVDSAGWFLSVKELLDELLDLWNSGGSSDKNNLVDIILLEVRVFKNLLHWLESSTEEIHVELLELGTGEGLREVFSVEEGLDLNLGLMLGGESSLCLLDLTTELLNGTLVLAEILSRLLLVKLDEVLHDTLIEIFSSQVGISVGGQHLEDSVVDGDSGGGWLVDDTNNVQSSDGSGVLGSLTLGIIENHSGDFFWGELLVVRSDFNFDGWLVALVKNLEWPMFDIGLDGLVVVISSDEAFGIKDGVLWVDGELVLGGISDQTLSLLSGEGNVGWGDTLTLVVGNDFNTSVLVDSDTGVGGSEIDTNDGSILGLLLLGFLLFFAVDTDGGKGDQAQQE
ncbi:hypothetical protein GCK72_024515 [Caenorhabditis remanei]|uniref:Uncharacterized protein n=1 Tax=Caenorhabditis remanei TaxID=31234 RepID=A0A6A5FZF8_CAERE|nr:hypothetical protein GCK72_024515 [Caenorhabditis remanei]KAF1748048.1 hypothetical protein GCK72_024515 [Caenorhabditis remanei]